MRKSSENGLVERRRFPRYPCTGTAEVLIIQSGKSRRWGTVKDISRVGCYIETMYPLSAGAEVELRFTIAGISLDIAANVVSSHPTFGMGMDFAAPTEQWKVSQIITELANVRPLTRSADKRASPQRAFAVSHARRLETFRASAKRTSRSHTR